MNNKIDELSVNAIRVLSADAIEKAKSGHPGLPLGMAPACYELWAHHMRFNSQDPGWDNRDRFILSGGHGSMLLYSLLHLFGYGLTRGDLMQFRQFGSKTPGHPEYGHTAGVEATTGPLGAGIGMAVGMAAAEKHLAAIFNRPGYPVVDHRTYVECGDGDLMEGISSEALSLAGTWNLSKLTVLYDRNHISIEGGTDLAFTEDVEKRVQAFGFKTLTVEDGNDLEAIGRALEAAAKDDSAPYFLIIHTQIGYGCPAKQGTAAAHGAPLGEDNILAMKDFLQWPSKEPFYVPQEVYDHCKAIADAKRADEEQWKQMFAAYRAAFPDLAAKWDVFHSDGAVAALKNDAGFFVPAEKAEASRASSGAIIQYMKDKIPNLFGGSADLAPSTKTDMKGEPFFSAADPAGRNLHFGVREMAMGAIANGMLLHGGLHTYIGTFFVFCDYMKPMMRLAALMRIPQIYVLTHDSIGVGEDGPTHEPVEQLAMLRSIPNFHVYRPCSRIETEAAWYMALSSKHTPTALVLTRQALSQEGDAAGAMRGGYILKDCEGTPEIILIATGSEVGLALQAQEKLTADGRRTRVVSMPCTEVFDEQSEEYRESVLPKAVRRRVAIEAATCFGWERYTGLDGAVIGMKTFGMSAPQNKLFEHFGFTVENVVKTAEEL